MTFALSRDPGKLMQAIPALAASAVTAGGGGDDTDANGVAIDLLATGRPKAESILFVVQANAVLGAAATIALPIRVQDSDNGSTGWADVVDPRVNGGSGTFTATTTSGAGAATVQQITQIGVPLEYCKRYVRVVAKPNMSAANTDTASVQGVAILFGLQKL